MPGMTLQDVYRAIRTAMTPEEIDRAERVAATHAARHPDDEPFIAAACEMLVMKRDSIALYGASPRTRENRF